MGIEKSKIPTEYYVWMSLALGIGNKDVSVFTSKFDNPMEFYNQRKQFVDDTEALSEAGKTKILNTSLDKAHEICVQCDKLGYKIFHYQHEYYPNKLKNIYDFPVVLYATGQHPDVHKDFAVTMVGTRKPSPYSQLAARYISRDLAMAGATVVSGLAVGIDKICHTGCLEAKGKTVAFLACGLDKDYPRENRKLREAIEKNGMIYTEHCIGERPESWHFPIRNRLLSGFSDAVMLVEGRQKSGSMHTITHGIDQGKDIFALPGDIFNINSLGAFNLIKDGATPVMSAMDILAEYLIKYPDLIDITKVHDNFFNGYNTNKVKKSPTTNIVSNSFKETSKIDSTIQKAAPINETITKENERIAVEEISEIAFDIYKCLENAAHIDEIVQKIQKPMGQVITGLTQLEIEGYIISMPGKIYKRQE